VLRKNPNIRIEVEGHTDNKGKPAYNMNLSDRRAASVKKYLISHGVSSDRLISRGYGMTMPLVPNDSDQNRALNRRVQFIRTEGGQSTSPP
jgi:OOP family OmpA-OmpF porin